MSDITVNVTDEIVQVDVTDEIIEVNVNNAQGPAGPAGQGVPTGGSTGQVLKKLSGADYDTYWALDGGGVPYIGATGNVDLGEYELKAGQIELDQTPTGVAGVAVTRWNDTIGSTETTLKGGSVVLKNGVDLVARVVNKVTPNATLTKAQYQAVRVTGAQGQRLAVAYAQANNDNNSADTIGLVTETIATNQEGFIMTVGSLEGINTTGSLQGETWSDGDVLYLSPTTPGALTNVKPVAPQHIVVIGYVEYAHQNNGKIYVKVMNGWELGELHDVNTTGAVAGQVLKYNGTIWAPATDAGANIYNSDGTLTGNRTVTQAGNSITFSGGNFNINTNGQSVGISTYFGANSVGENIFVGGGGNSSVGAVGETYKGSYNASFGSGSLLNNTTGYYNTGLGFNSLRFNTTGYFNNAVGVDALRFNTSGYNNIAVGTDAISSNTTGFNNSAIGVEAGKLISSGGANQTSDNSIYIGYRTRANVNGGTNEIVIGSQTTGNGSNTVTLGNNFITNTYLKGVLNVGTINAATTDTDKFLVSDSGVVKFRTGAEVLSDIGAQAALTNPITGSAASGQVAYFTGATTQAGSNNLFWDATNNRLGIGTNAPTTILDVYSSSLTASVFKVGTSQNVSIFANTQSANRFQLFNISRVGSPTTEGISFGMGTGPTASSGIISANNDNLIFGYALSGAFNETFRITTTKNLLLGTTTDSGQRLQVGGSSVFYGTLSVPGTVSGVTINPVNSGAGIFIDQPYNNAALNISSGANATAVTITKSGYANVITATGSSGTATFNNNYAGFQYTGTYQHNGTSGLGQGIIINVTNNTGTSNTLTGTYISATANSAGATAIGLDVQASSTSGTALAIRATGQVNFTGSVTGIGNSSTYTVTASSGSAVSKSITSTLVAAANNDTLVGLDVNPTFSNGAFTGVSNYVARLGNHVGISTASAFTLNYITFRAITANQGISAGFVPNGTPTGYAYNFQFDKSNTANTNSLLIIGGGSSAGGNAANKHVISTSCDGTATAQPLILRVAGTGANWGTVNDHLTLFSTGNLVIQNSSASATDSGQRLQVIGSARIGSTAASAMYWDDTNNRLGIGTSTPGASLAVNGNAFFAAKITIKGNAAGTLGNSSGLELYQDAVTDTSYLYNFYNGPLLLGTNNTERVRITAAGRLLLGTTTEVAGTEMIISGSETASSAIARGTLINTTLTAAANNDVLVGLDVNPTFTNGAFTGVSNWGVRTQSMLIGTSSITGQTDIFQVKSANAIVSLQNTQNNLYAGVNMFDDTATLTGSFAIGGTAATVPALAGHFFFGARKSTGRTIIVGGTGATQLATMFSTGNFLIQNAGTHTDAGFRLDVNGTARVQGDFTLSDTRNIIVGTTTGTKIGTATSQKIGFWNATPIVQPTTAVAAATFVANTSGIANDTATFDGYTIGQIVKALRNAGLLA